VSQPDISNLARRLAEQNNVAWQSLKGTGPDGRVVERDVLDYLARVMAGEEAVDPTPEPLPEGMEAWTEVGADSVGNYSRPVTPGSVSRAAPEGEEDAAEAPTQVAELGDDVFLFDDDDDDFEAAESAAAFGVGDGADVGVELGGTAAEPGHAQGAGLVTPDLDDELLLVSDDDLDADAPGDEPYGADLGGEVPAGDTSPASVLEAAETAEPYGPPHDHLGAGPEVGAAEEEEPAPAWGGSELRLDSEPYEPVPGTAPDLWEDGEEVDAPTIGAVMFEAEGASAAAESTEPGGSVPAAEAFEPEGSVPAAEAFEPGGSVPAAEAFEPEGPAPAAETLEGGEFSAAGTADATGEVPYGVAELSERWQQPADHGGTGAFDELGVGEADLDAYEQTAPALPLVHTPNLLRRNVDLSALAAAQLAVGLELGLDGPLGVAPFLVRAAAKAAQDVGLTGGHVALAEIEAGILLRRVDGAAGGAFVDLVRELAGARTEEDEVALVAVDLSMLDVDEAFLDVGAPAVTLGRILYDSEVGGYRSTLALTGELPLDQGARLLVRVAELLTSPVRLLV